LGGPSAPRRALAEQSVLKADAGSEGKGSQLPGGSHGGMQIASTSCCCAATGSRRRNCGAAPEGTAIKSHIEVHRQLRSRSARWEDRWAYGRPAARGSVAPSRNEGPRLQGRRALLLSGWADTHNNWQFPRPSAANNGLAGERATKLAIDGGAKPWTVSGKGGERRVKPRRGERGWRRVVAGEHPRQTGSRSWPRGPWSLFGAQPGFAKHPGAHICNRDEITWRPRLRTQRSHAALLRRIAPFRRRRCCCRCRDDCRRRPQTRPPTHGRYSGAHAEPGCRRSAGWLPSIFALSKRRRPESPLPV